MHLIRDQAPSGKQPSEIEVIFFTIIQKFFSFVWLCSFFLVLYWWWFSGGWRAGISHPGEWPRPSLPFPHPSGFVSKYFNHLRIFHIPPNQTENDTIICNHLLLRLRSFWTFEGVGAVPHSSLVHQDLQTIFLSPPKTSISYSWAYPWWQYLFILSFAITKLWNPLMFRH